MEVRAYQTGRFWVLLCLDSQSCRCSFLMKEKMFLTTGHNLEPTADGRPRRQDRHVLAAASSRLVFTARHVSMSCLRYGISLPIQYLDSAC